MIALVTGYLMDLLTGDPHNIPHPVTGIGKLINLLTGHYKKKAEGETGRELRYGRLMVFIVCTFVVMSTTLVIAGCYKINIIPGMIAESILTCYILAARSLYTESIKVYNAIKLRDIEKARYDLSMIVGRDTGRLNEDGIIRAGVETVAENTSDGVLAPLLFLIIGGPVAGMLYKAVNTMDSMVGYKNEKFLYFGRAAAKLDDAANYVPSRISAMYIIISAYILRLFSKAYDGGSAYRIWRRDRYNHTSPNSAQTESAVAGALNIRLGGPSYYEGILVDKPFIGNDIRHIDVEDIKRSNLLMFISELLLLLSFMLPMVILIIIV